MTHPTDTVKLVDELRAIGEDDMYHHPATTKATIEAAATALASANEMNERLARALEFYRDAWGFKTNKRHPGLEYFPKEELLDDCGERARALLQSIPNKGDGSNG